MPTVKMGQKIKGHENFTQYNSTIWIVENTYSKCSNIILLDRIIKIEQKDIS